MKKLLFLLNMCNRIIYPGSFQKTLIWGREYNKYFLENLKTFSTNKQLLSSGAKDGLNDFSDKSSIQFNIYHRLVNGLVLSPSNCCILHHELICKIHSLRQKNVIFESMANEMICASFFAYRYTSSSYKDRVNIVGISRNCC